MALDPEGFKTICGQIATGLAKVVGLSNAGITDSDCEALVTALTGNNSLKIIYLSGNLITSIGAERLAAVFAYHPTLTILDLSTNLINATCGNSIGQMLASNTVLQQLILDYNAIADTGLSEIAGGLRNSANSALQFLSVYQNGVGIAGATAIAEVLPVCSLQTLNLGNNEILDAGATALAGELASSTLTSLQLYGCGIGNNGGIALALALPDAHLTNLNLENNGVGDSVASAFADALKGGAPLQSLILADSEITIIGEANFIDALSDSFRLTDLALNGELSPQTTALLNRNRECARGILNCPEVVTQPLTIQNNSTLSIPITPNTLYIKNIADGTLLAGNYTVSTVNCAFLNQQGLAVSRFSTEDVGNCVLRFQLNGTGTVRYQVRAIISGNLSTWPRIGVINITRVPINIFPCVPVTPRTTITQSFTTAPSSSATINLSQAVNSSASSTAASTILLPIAASISGVVGLLIVIFLIIWFYRSVYCYGSNKHLNQINDSFAGDHTGAFQFFNPIGRLGHEAFDSHNSPGEEGWRKNGYYTRAAATQIPPARKITFFNSVNGSALQESQVDVSPEGRVTASDTLLHVYSYASLQVGTPTQVYAIPNAESDSSTAHPYEYDKAFSPS